MPSRHLYSLLVALALVVAACTSSTAEAGKQPSSTTLAAGTSSETTQPDTSSTTQVAETTPTTAALLSIPTDYSGYLQQPTACGAERPTPATDLKFDAPGDAAVAGVIIVTLHTSCGPIEIELDSTIAPESVNSFVFLAESGYFDGTVSHRILPGFMMQAGDPTATGRGGPGYVVSDEFPVDGTVYERGIVAMANAGPGTTGSQFFIMFEDIDWLPAQYTIIGRVTSGLDALDRIAGIPLGAGPNSADGSPSTPLESIYIDSVTVRR